MKKKNIHERFFWGLDKQKKEKKEDFPQFHEKKKHDCEVQGSS